MLNPISFQTVVKDTATGAQAGSVSHAGPLCPASERT